MKGFDGRSPKLGATQAQHMVHVEAHLIAWVVAGIFSAAAVVVSVRLIREHTAAMLSAAEVCPAPFC